MCFMFADCLQSFLLSNVYWYFSPSQLCQKVRKNVQTGGERSDNTHNNKVSVMVSTITMYSFNHNESESITETEQRHVYNKHRLTK